MKLPPLLCTLACVLSGTNPSYSQNSTPETPTWAGPNFRDFSGACQAVPDLATSELWQEALGWSRNGVSWEFSQPEPGQWNEAYLEQSYAQIAQFGRMGVHVLPILGYNARWSSEELSLDVPYETFYGENWRREIEVRPDGDYDARTYTRRSSDAPWGLDKTFTISGFRKNKIPLALHHVPDWENYVRRIVSDLRESPHGLSYFQIWNEAHPKSGFWDGDLDTYMQRVHLPAAKIIQDLGGKVVYGGWIHGAPVSELVELLDRHHAWSTIDVLDVHYMPPAAFAEIRAAADARGWTNLGIWQTELANSPDPGWISNNYPRFLHWALSNDWDYRDKYKLFFFSFKNPKLSTRETAKDRTLYVNDKLSPHGQGLTVLADLLRGDGLKVVHEFHTTPALAADLKPGKASIEVFRVQNRIIAALHVDHDLVQQLPETHGSKTMTLNLGPADLLPLSVQRIDIAGGRQDIRAAASLHNGTLQIVVPVANAPDTLAMRWAQASRGPRTCFVEIVMSEPAPPRSP